MEVTSSLEMYTWAVLDASVRRVTFLPTIEPMRGPAPNLNTADPIPLEILSLLRWDEQRLLQALCEKGRMPLIEELLNTTESEAELRSV